MASDGKEASIQLLPRAASSFRAIPDRLATHAQRAHRRYFAGWRWGVVRSTVTAAVACLFMLFLTVGIEVALDVHRGSATIVRGKCNLIAVADVFVHLALNIASTLILAAGNYCMQGLCSPTRQEVDSAHAQKRWLDIGSQSLRNLRSISRVKAVLWVILALSSLPLHLVFNSGFFKTKQANQYAVAVVSSDFLNLTNWEPTEQNSSPSLFPTKDETLDIFYQKDELAVPLLLKSTRDHSVNFSVLNKEKCLNTYSNGFIQGLSNVIVITNSTNATTPLLWSRYPERHVVNGETIDDPFAWVCSDLHLDPDDSDEKKPEPCNLEAAVEKTGNAANWTVYGHSVNYCLAQEVENLCELRCNQWILICVVTFSGISTLVMVGMCWKAFQDHEDATLRTTGDAIKSFLRSEDRTTVGMCLISEHELWRSDWRDEYEPQAYQGSTKKKWHDSVKRLQYWTSHTFIVLFTLGMATCLYFALAGRHHSSLDTTLGHVDIQSLTKVISDSAGSSTFIPTVIVANLPQLLFAMVYLVHNSLFSRMLVAREWSKFSIRPKPLRVSHVPYGAQKTSRMLSIPGKYAISLMGFSALIHWLLSQSLYLVWIYGIDVHGIIDEADTISRLGYSSQGILIVVVLLLVAVIATFAFGRWGKLHGGMPLGGSNSAVISAACHSIDGEEGAELHWLKWGEVEGHAGFQEQESGIIRPDASCPTTDIYDGGKKRSGGGEDIGHCGFSSRRVLQPTIGKRYA